MTMVTSPCIAARAARQDWRSYLRGQGRATSGTRHANASWTVLYPAPPTMMDAPGKRSMAGQWRIQRSVGQPGGQTGAMQSASVKRADTSPYHSNSSAFPDAHTIGWPCALAALSSSEDLTSHGEVTWPGNSEPSPAPGI